MPSPFHRYGPTLFTAFSALLAALPAAAEPKLHIVEMITDAGAKKFEPRSLAVSVGDTVRFVNVSGNHNTQSVEGMIPNGVAPWLSDIGEEFEVLVTEEGIFGYICTPHLENGMVGLFYTEDAAANFIEAEAATATLPDRPWLIFDILLEPFRS